MTGDPQEMAARAEDYVLGLLDGGEEEAFERELAGDPALARLVAQARDRLLPLDLSAPDAPLPAGFAARVHATIAAEAGKGRVVPLPAARPAARRVLAWLPALAAGIGLFVGVALGWMLAPQPEPLVIAILLDENGVPQAMVEDFGNDTAMVRFLADVQVPEGRTMEVWTLPSEELGPVSLGTVGAVAPTRLSGPELPRPAGQQLYEITFEPLGGSPTGRPTGPILGKGYAAPQAF